MPDDSPKILLVSSGLGASSSSCSYASVALAGLPVHLHVDGERIPLSRARDLSAYRIVQEGLTNA